MSVLAIDAVSKDYGDLLALDRVSMQVDVGEQVMLVGPNGSGKTTLLRIAAGLLDATGGTVAINDRGPSTQAARAALSFVGDTPVLYDDLSVMEHLEFIARLHGVADWSVRAEELLERLGLSDRAGDLPSRFSRGLRQKTAIAVALVRPFSVLLVDEPFVGLDSQGKAAFLGLVGDAAASAAIIVATHQPDYATQASRVVAMRDGRVVADGPPSREVLAEFVADPSAAEARDALHPDDDR